MKIELAALRPHPQNYNRHPAAQVEKIKRSLSRFGQRKPITTWRGMVLTGHGVYEAARALGWSEIWAEPCPEEWTEAEALAWLAADNELARGADPDEDALAALVAGLQDVDAELAALAAGTDERLKELMASLQTAQAGDDPGPQVDKAAELQAKWGVNVGDLWELGTHRLICGDCTDRTVVERVMGGEIGDLWLTDPPYAVSYADKNRYLNAIARGNRIQVPIENDHLSLDDAAALWQAAATIALEFCADHASYYWFACQGGDQMMMMMMRLSEAGWRVRHELIWVKNNHVLGRTDYNYKHEPILYGWKKDGKHVFYGGFQTSVLEFPKPQQSDMHPTTKPVELVERLIVNSSKSGDVVIDGFLGSGTTLIACEKLGRRARCVEIEPGYVAVALERWATMTGKTPVLVASGDNALLARGKEKP